MSVTVLYFIRIPILRVLIYAFKFLRQIKPNIYTQSVSETTGQTTNFCFVNCGRNPLITSKIQGTSLHGEPCFCFKTLTVNENISMIIFRVSLFIWNDIMRSAGKCNIHVQTTPQNVADSTNNITHSITG